MTQRISVPAGISVPDEVYQQAKTYQLGEMTRFFKPRFSNLFALLGLVLGSLVGDILLLVGIAYLTGIVFYYLVLFPIFVLIMAIGALPNHNLRIYVFVHGFIRAKGKRYEVVRWDNVEEVWQQERLNNYVPSAFTCTLRLRDGRTLKLGDALRFIYDLTTIIQAEVAKQQLPQAIAAYKAGEPVRFGKVTVDVRGINNGKELIPWDQAEAIAVKEGKVVVLKYGRPLKWSPIKEQETPNLSLLMSLVEHVVSQQ